MPRLFRAIVQDSTVYFLVIFTTHFVLEMTLLFGRVSTSTVGDRSGAEKPPAKYSTLTVCVSPRFDSRHKLKLIISSRLFNADT